MGHRRRRRAPVAPEHLLKRLIREQAADRRQDQKQTRHRLPIPRRDALAAAGLPGSKP